MKLPFTIEQFFDVFVAYNTAIWPAHVFAYGLGVMAMIMAYKESKLSAQIICGILALFWAWMGIFYHMFFFRSINPAAFLFGIAFVVQGLLFLLAGLTSNKLQFRFTLKPLSIIGACFIFYGMLIYPLLGLYFGHTYPKAPMFGVAPCPTTIFTFGILLLTTKSIPVHLLIIPFLWSIVGMSAAVNLGVVQDYGLVIAGIVGLILIVINNQKIRNLKRFSCPLITVLCLFASLFSNP